MRQFDTVNKPASPPPRPPSVFGVGGAVRRREVGSRSLPGLPIAEFELCGNNKESPKAERRRQTI